MSPVVSLDATLTEKFKNMADAFKTKMKDGGMNVANTTDVNLLLNNMSE